MKFNTCFVFLLLPSTIVSAIERSSAHDVYDNLMITQHYNKKVRPVLNASHPLNVNVSLYLLNIISFNEIAEELSITAKLRVSWRDDYLVWDPSVYGGLAVINLPQPDVWTPDITLENSVTSYTSLGDPGMYLSVTYEGKITWKPMQIFRSTCPADITHFPMDTQKCCLNFEAWSYSSQQVALVSPDTVVHHHGVVGQSEWKVVSTTVGTLAINGDRYVQFCLTLKRNYVFLFLNLIIPTSFMAILNCCVFLLPVTSGEKASFSITVYLSLVVFLTIVSQQLPETSDSVSIFNVFIFTQVVFSTFSTVVAILQLKLFHMSENVQVPYWLLRLTNQCPPKVGESGHDDVVSVESCSNNDLNKKVTPSQTWEITVDRLDALYFRMCVVLNVVLILSIMFAAIVKHSSL